MSGSAWEAACWPRSSFELMQAEGEQTLACAPDRQWVQLKRLDVQYLSSLNCFHQLEKPEYPKSIAAPVPHRGLQWFLAHKGTLKFCPLQTNYTIGWGFKFQQIIRYPIVVLFDGGVAWEASCLPWSCSELMQAGVEQTLPLAPSRRRA